MSQKPNLEKAFKTAKYITSSGHDSSEGGQATISKTYLLNNQKYYVIGYLGKSFAVFTYYNGTITKIYAFTSKFALNITDIGSALRLEFGSSSYLAESFGLIVLTFGVDMVAAFANLFDEVTAGLGGGYSSAYTRTFDLTNFISAGEKKYLFIGSSNKFCVYMAEGTTYSELTALFNYNLYLINGGNTSVNLSSNNSTAVYVYGYAFLSAKG